jgi:hypothetical protein
MSRQRSQDYSNGVGGAIRARSSACGGSKSQRDVSREQIILISLDAELFDIQLEAEGVLQYNSDFDWFPGGDHLLCTGSHELFSQHLEKTEHTSASSSVFERGLYRKTSFVAVKDFLPWIWNSFLYGATLFGK